MRNCAEARYQYLVSNFISQLSDFGWAWFYHFYNSVDLHSSLQRVSISNYNAVRVCSVRGQQPLPQIPEKCTIIVFHLTFSRQKLFGALLFKVEAIPLS